MNIRNLFILTVILFCFSYIYAENNIWVTDLDQGFKLAKAQNKLVLVDFTGSDWCQWCMKLDNEVLSKQKFIDYATKKFILVRVDFPRKSTQTDVEKKKNKEWAEKYKIEGFPTILLLNSKGALVATTGYQEGGEGAYIKHLDGLLKKGSK